MPAEFQRQARRELLRLEALLASRQGDVGLVSGFAFDPGIDKTMEYFMKPTSMTLA